MKRELYNEWLAKPQKTKREKGLEGLVEFQAHKGAAAAGDVCSKAFSL